eukprot:2572921-Prymnesium_polylepis.1
MPIQRFGATDGGLNMYIRTHAMEPTAACGAMSFRTRTRDGLHSGSAAQRVSVEVVECNAM